MSPASRTPRQAPGERLLQVVSAPIRDADKDALSRLATQDGRSVAYLVREAITAYLQRRLGAAESVA